jgi:YidC/Oxa1 family membrane protein insertase
VAHQFDLFLGPKRSALLDPLKAAELMNYGWWGGISRPLLGLLNFFHHTAGMPYALAIILLTVCVRGALFPISIRQAGSAQKMKEIQPELSALRKQYAQEPEKFALAQRDLFRKHNYNPFAGCLPVFLQLPIFIGLYNALSQAVDLRLARFLWVDNLAAPDGLFSFGFQIPWLRWNEFNLLPIIVVSLFIWQQKLFMPPPTNDEERLQAKMFMGMTVMMGFMFYKSQAGLCLYFIASSLWGIVERKLLDRLKPHIAAAEARKQARRETAKAERQPGWFDKLLAAADEARKQTNGQSASGDATAGSREKKGSRSGR